MIDIKIGIDILPSSLGIKDPSRVTWWRVGGVETSGLLTLEV